MPDLQTALLARLKAAPAVTAITPRIYWGIVPQAAALPYIRLQTISDPRPEHLKGYTGGRQARVQADCMSLSYAEARTMAEAVIAATANPAIVAGVKFGRIKAEGPRDLGEDTEKGYVHRASLDLLAEFTIA